MPRRRAGPPKPVPPPIGTRVRILPNPIHPRLAGWTAIVVRYSSGYHADHGHPLNAKVQYPSGGNPIVEIRGRRFLFKAEHLELITRPDPTRDSTPQRR